MTALRKVANSEHADRPKIRIQHGETTQSAALHKSSRIIDILMDSAVDDGFRHDIDCLEP